MFASLLTSVLLMVVSADENSAKAWSPKLGASVGFFVNDPTLSLHARLTVEFDFYKNVPDELAVLVSVGSATAVLLTPEVTRVTGLTELYQHVAVVGIAYRATRQLVHWGFHVAFGPLWYRAAFSPNAGYRPESRVLPYTEGRIQLGLRVFPQVVIGLYGGYASPWDFHPRYPGNRYVGGLMGGLFCDWRE